MTSTVGQPLRMARSAWRLMLGYLVLENEIDCTPLGFWHPLAPVGTGGGVGVGVAVGLGVGVGVGTGGAAVGVGVGVPPALLQAQGSASQAMPSWSPSRRSGSAAGPPRAT